MKWFYLVAFFSAILNALVVGVYHGGPFLHWFGWCLTAMFMLPNLIHVWCSSAPNA